MLEYMADAGGVESSELITNGYLLTEEISKAVTQYLNKIIIGIEGLDEQTYFNIIGVHINFEELLNNIRCLYENKHECKIIVKIHDKAIKSEADERKFYKLFESISDYMTIENIVDTWPEFDSTLTPMVWDNFRFKSEAYDDVKMIRHQVCHRFFKAIQICADGDVLLCCFDWERKNYIGNIKNAGIYEIWNGSKANGLRWIHLNGKNGEIDPCKSCRANDYCEVDNIDSYTEQIKAIMEEKGCYPPPHIGFIYISDFFCTTASALKEVMR